MKLIALLLICFAAYIQSRPQGAIPGDASIVYQWKWLNFTFEDTAAYQNYYNNEYYKHCMLAGIKLASDGRIFVSVPRWFEGVPATLSVLDTSHSPPLLKPYPSWEGNKIGDPSKLQSVLGYEIDPFNRLWVLDQGKINNQPAIPGSIKLQIFDLATDTLIRQYTFSESEASLANSFINDIVIDVKRSFAYISDTGIGAVPLHGGILVYDYENNVMRRVLNQHVSTQPNMSLWFSINGDKVLADAPFHAGADGIALSNDANTLYYTPLSSRIIYKIDTATLRDFNQPLSNISARAQKYKNKQTTSDGLACTNEVGDIVYATALEKSGILKITPDYDNLVANDTAQMVWPDTIGFDNLGYMYWTTNILHLFYQGKLNYDNYNFRIWRYHIGAKSYMYPPDLE